MSGALTHSPEEIIAKALIDLGLGDDPNTSTTDFPVYKTQEPDSPDEVITVYGTTGVKQGRVQINGETQERDGIQIRVRAANHSSGFAKVRAIAVALDEQINYTGVLIGGTSYRLFSFSRTSGPIPLGKDSPQTKRDIFTLNGTAMIRQL